MTNYTIRGQYNEISESAVIGDNTIISGWTFIGKNVKIGSNCRFGNHVNINDGVVIGNNTNIEDKTIITVNGKVGNNCFLGAVVMFVDEKYPTADPNKKARKPIVVEDNCIIGTRVSLMRCKVGKGSVVGVDSLVNHDVPPNQVWVGNPAKFLMTRKEYDQKQKEFLID